MSFEPENSSPSEALRSDDRLWAGLGAIGFSFVSLALVVLVGAAPRTGGTVAAVFPPWWTPTETISAAGQAGSVAAIGGWRHIVIVKGEPGQLQHRLWAAGALALLDPQGAGGCLVAQGKPS